MSGRRLLTILSMTVLIAAACGGTDIANDLPEDTDIPSVEGDGSTNSEEGGDQGADAEQQNTDGGSLDSGPPVLDPNDMPPPGEALFEVDGQVFTIAADTMDYFLCDSNEEFPNVQSESETQDLSVQFDAQSGRGNAGVEAEGTGLRYSSFVGPETPGGVSVDGPHILYEARFDATALEDINDTADVGLGRISVTCP